MQQPRWQQQELELAVKFLEIRADFWGQFARHRATARILRNEANLLRLGHHAKFRSGTELEQAR